MIFYLFQVISLMSKSRLFILGLLLTLGFPACSKMNNYTVKIEASGNQAAITNVYITHYDEKRVKKTEVLTPNQPKFEGNYRSLNRKDFKVLAQAKTATINTIPVSVQPISISITILKDGAIVKHETERSLTGFVSEETDTDGD